MAAYNQRKVEHIQHEYALDSPAHSDEIGKAVSAAYNDINRMKTHHDLQGNPMVFVKSQDDEIVIYWEEKK